MYCLYISLYGVKMKAELMALALFIASIGIIMAQTAPWEHTNDNGLPGLSNLPSSGSYTLLAGSSWQPSLMERFLLFGLGASASCVMLACLRHLKKESKISDESSDTDLGVEIFEN
jgi:hypothetical protein